MEYFLHRWLVKCLLVGLCLWLSPLQAQEVSAQDVAEPQEQIPGLTILPPTSSLDKPLSRSGKDAICTKCHDENEARPIFSLYQTRHGVKADVRTPACQSCHGESESHLSGGTALKGRVAPDVIFGSRKSTSAGYEASDPMLQNNACLACHKKDVKRSHWEGSTHQNRNVACVACHEIHAAHDKVSDKRTQPVVCFTCHKEQRTQISRPSHHPILEGKMACSDCHNPHGSVGPKLMKRDSVNDTCYICHAEKRGPFVHNHQPVSEDCSNCHNPHGTTVESMLKMRTPFLCHTCHTPHGGNVPALAGATIPGLSPTPTSGGKSNINYTQGLGCLNCHTQIHGSNNPSATNPTPQFFFR
jgi:DmsE family decaheme c-type cytochrome